MSQSQAGPASDERLKPTEYVGYALGDTASNFFFPTFNIFLTYYYVDVWGIPATEFPPSKRLHLGSSRLM